MIARAAIVTAFAAASVGVAAADDRCSDQQAGRAAAGALVGGVIGAVIGAQIGDDDDHYRGRKGRGRGYGRRYRYYERHSSNEDEVLAGAALGALAGAVVGGASTNCDRHSSYNPYGGYGRYDGYDSGYRQTNFGGTTHGYGDYPAHLVRQHRAQPAVRWYTTETGSYSAPLNEGYVEPYEALAGGPTVAAGPGGSSGGGGLVECRQVLRETTLPDGVVVREPATACPDAQTGGWRITVD